MIERKIVAVARPFGWHYRAIDKNGNYGEGWLNSAEISKNKVVEYLLQRHSRILEIESDGVNPKFAKAFASGTEISRCSATDNMELVDDDTGEWYVWEEEQ